MKKFTRREVLGIMGTGAAGLLTAGTMLPIPEDKHIITLSFDDGFKKSSIRTAEIYEKYNMKSCINVVANGHLRGNNLPDEYHAWPVGDFTLWNDLKRRGHEVMPHGYRHANLTQMPMDEAKELVFKCIDLFNKEMEGFRASESVFNLPYNASTPELESWLYTRFRIIRTHGDAINPLPGRDLVRLGCGSHGPDSIDRHLVESIDRFLEGPPGWFVYNTHGLDDEGWGPLSSGVLDELLDRLTGLENVFVLPVIPALSLT